MPNQRIRVNSEWSEPVSVEYEKRIISHFNPEYKFFSVKVTGSNGNEYVKTIFGKSPDIIMSQTISHIIDPAVSYRTDSDTSMEVIIELKQ